MKDGGWIPIDKRLVNLLPKSREYTFIEAYISLCYDLEQGAEISINGYARIWSWSRNKVRSFIEGLRTGKGHVVDNQRTGKGQEIRIIFNNLKDVKDKQGTGEEGARDSQGTTTINPNKIPYGEIIADLNQKGGFRYTACDSAKRHINARFAEGFTEQDFFHVHSVKVDEWKGTPNAKYLRPETLYGNKFQGYVNQPLLIKSGTPEWF